jgi:hypothetical protein
MCAHLFHLRSRERLGAGLVCGALLLVTLSNLSAQALGLPSGFWLAAVLIAAMGLLSAWTSKRRPRFPLQDLRAWPQLLLFAAFFCYS